MNGMPAPLEGLGIGLLVCILVGGFAFGVVVNAGILLAAAVAFNGLAGAGPMRIPELGLAKALLVIALVLVVVTLAIIPIHIAIDPPRIDPKAKEIPREYYYIGLALMPVSFLILAAWLKWILPTSFPKALLVALIFNVISILIQIVIALGVLMVIFLAMGGRG